MHAHAVILQFVIYQTAQDTCTFRPLVRFVSIITDTHSLCFHVPFSPSTLEPDTVLEHENIVNLPAWVSHAAHLLTSVCWHIKHHFPYYSFLIVSHFNVKPWARLRSSNFQDLNVWYNSILPVKDSSRKKKKWKCNFYLLAHETRKSSDELVLKCSCEGRGRKNRRTRRKSLGARTRITNKLYPLMTPNPGFEPIDALSTPHWFITVPRWCIIQAALAISGD